MVQGIVEGTIDWVKDPDFGYDIAVSVLGIDDIELLQPLRLYERQDRGETYRDYVQRLKKERDAYLADFTALDPTVGAGLYG